jgi:DNA-directed RNA polymerase subunit RPC12/RpoP
MNSYECVECGLRFTLPQNLKQHREDHVSQRLAAYHQKEVKRLRSYTPKSLKVTQLLFEEWRGSDKENSWTILDASVPKG